MIQNLLNPPVPVAFVILCALAILTAYVLCAWWRRRRRRYIRVDRVTVDTAALARWLYQHRLEGSDSLEQIRRRAR